MWTTIFGVLTVLAAVLAASGVTGAWSAFFAVLAFAFLAVFLFALSGAIGHRRARSRGDAPWAR